MLTRALPTFALMIAALICAVPPVRAQAPAYPQSKPVRIIVPFAAGGVTDLMGRILAQKMGEDLNQRFLVENRPGAGGNVGSEFVAKSPPDGYTLAMGTVSSHAINPNLYAKMPYDNLRDFAPVSLMVRQPNTLVVNSSVKAANLTEFVALLKAKPNAYSYGSSGIGTSTHLAAELFKMMTGTEMAHVPYKASSEVMTAVIGGEVQLAFDNVASVLQHVQQGTLRALGVTGRERSPLLPDVPAIREVLPGFEATSWHGLFAPAGTPPAIVDLLSREVQKIVREPDVGERLRQLGATPVGNTPAEFTAFVAEETKKWADVVKASGAKVE